MSERARTLLRMAQDEGDKVVGGPNDAEAILRPAGRGVWSLQLGGRVRWGNKNEMISDLLFFWENGELPSVAKGGWA